MTQTVILAVLFREGLGLLLGDFISMVEWDLKCWDCEALLRMLSGHTANETGVQMVETVGQGPTILCPCKLRS